MENNDVETESVKYPVKVDYCPNCSMPFEVRYEMLKLEGSKKSNIRNCDLFLVL
jgi:hypothetical protein